MIDHIQSQLAPKPMPFPLNYPASAVIFSGAPEIVVVHVHGLKGADSSASRHRCEGRTWVQKNVLGRVEQGKKHMPGEGL